MKKFTSHKKLSYTIVISTICILFCGFIFAQSATDIARQKLLNSQATPDLSQAASSNNTSYVMENLVSGWWSSDSWKPYVEPPVATDITPPTPWQDIAKYNSDRTLKTANWLVPSDTCNPYQALAFYAGSDVNFVLYSEPLRDDDYAILSSSYAWRYWDIFWAWLKFPFSSNIQPTKTTTTTTDNKILITKVDWTQFVIPDSYNVPRWYIAWQLGTWNEYRLIYLNWWADYTYNFTNISPINTVSIVKTNDLSPNSHFKKSCTNYYLAYCGDGVVDKKDKNIWSNKDGFWGIQTSYDWFIPWHPKSIIPDEECDNGKNNWILWATCSIDCKKQAFYPIPWICNSITTTVIDQKVDVTCFGEGYGYTIEIWNWIDKLFSKTWNQDDSFSVSVDKLPSSNLQARCIVDSNMTLNPLPDGSVCNKAFNIDGKNPVLSITKKLQDNKTYLPWEIATFIIDFANTWPWIATNINITDIFSTSLDLVSVEIKWINSNVFFANYVNWW